MLSSSSLLVISFPSGVLPISNAFSVICSLSGQSTVYNYVLVGYPLLWVILCGVDDNYWERLILQLMQLQPRNTCMTEFSSKVSNHLLINLTIFTYLKAVVWLNPSDPYSNTPTIRTVLLHFC